MIIQPTAKLMSDLAKYRIAVIVAGTIPAGLHAEDSAEGTVVENENTAGSEMM